MSIRTRELYASPNGDRWYLGCQPQSEQIYVKHVGNEASGGHVSQLDVGAFLMRGHGPEQQALLRLIGSLTEGRFDFDKACDSDERPHPAASNSNAQEDPSERPCD